MQCNAIASLTQSPAKTDKQSSKNIYLSNKFIHSLNSLAIRLRSEDLHHLLLVNGVPELQGKHLSFPSPNKLTCRNVS